MSKVENCVLGAESDFRRVDKDLSSLEERVSKQPIPSLCGEEIVKRATWCSATFDLVHHLQVFCILAQLVEQGQESFFWVILSNRISRLLRNNVFAPAA